MKDINKYPLRTIDETNKEIVNQAAQKITLAGLNYKQRRFCLAYPATGSPTLAAEVAGYCAKEADPAMKRGKLRAAVATLMRNPTIRRNLDIINAELEKGGVASALRIKLFWTEVMEDAGQPITSRLQAAKLLSSCYPDFSDKLLIHQRQDTKITVHLKSHVPTTPEEQAEYDRLEKAIAEDQRLELAAMGKDPDVIETSNTEASGDDLLMTNRR